jgi:hypothetical protein
MPSQNTNEYQVGHVSPAQPSVCPTCKKRLPQFTGRRVTEADQRGGRSETVTTLTCPVHGIVYEDKVLS